MEERKACGGCCRNGMCTVQKSRMEGSLGVGSRRAQWPELGCSFRVGCGAGSRGSQGAGVGTTVGLRPPKAHPVDRVEVNLPEAAAQALGNEPQALGSAPGCRGFESWLCHLLPMWPSASYFNLCVPQFLQIENGTNESHPFPWVALRIKHMDIAAVPGTGHQHCVFVKHKQVTRAAH